MLNAGTSGFFYAVVVAGFHVLTNFPVMSIYSL